LEEMEAALREKLEAREQEEALLARMDEIAQRVESLESRESEAAEGEGAASELSERMESIEVRVTKLSDDQQLATAKSSTKSEALASRFGELEWRIGEVLEKNEGDSEKSEEDEGGVTELTQRLEQLETQLKTLEETPAGPASESMEDYAATFEEHKQFIERNERVLRALAVKVARMSEGSSEK